MPHVRERDGDFDPTSPAPKRAVIGGAVRDDDASLAEREADADAEGAALEAGGAPTIDRELPASDVPVIGRTVDADDTSASDEPSR